MRAKKNFFNDTSKPPKKKKHARKPSMGYSRKQNG